MFVGRFALGLAAKPSAPGASLDVLFAAVLLPDLALLVAVLHLLYLGSLFGPPPPDERTLAVVALGVHLFPPWGWWVDRHRRTTS